MKKPIERLLVILFATLLLVSGGCKKGDTGPAGKDGKDGSANVTARTFSVATWSSSSSRWYTQLSMPEISSTNVNSTSVQVYIGTVPNNWIAIPSTVVASTDYFWGFLYTTGLVEVRWDYNGVGIGSDPNTIYGATVQVKVVVIPPAMKRPGINYHNYSEVKAAYGLKD